MRIRHLALIAAFGSIAAGFCAKVVDHGPFPVHRPAMMVLVIALLVTSAIAAVLTLGSAVLVAVGIIGRFRPAERLR